MAVFGMIDRYLFRLVRLVDISFVVWVNRFPQIRLKPRLAKLS